MEPSNRSREFREIGEPRESIRQTRELRETKEPRELKYTRESKDVSRELRELKDSREPKEVTKERREPTRPPRTRMQQARDNGTIDRNVNRGALKM